jgi:hypothetical protein
MVRVIGCRYNQLNSLCIILCCNIAMVNLFVVQRRQQSPPAWHQAEGNEIALSVHGVIASLVSVWEGYLSPD